MPDLETIVTDVSSSKKYGAVCLDTIRRVAERELIRHHSLKAATKATKRKLHQVYGAFESALDYDLAYQELSAACDSGSEQALKAVCRDIMATHSSTNERLPILDRFYLGIFELTGRPASLLDLGCGLNALALPWMGLPQSLRYIALDIDSERIHFVNRFLALIGLEPLARCQDILSHPPGDDADLALLLKMSPSLERQEPGATLRLMEQVNAPTVVVSYAVKSLGGREKGMVGHYQQYFAQLVAEQEWTVKELVLESELVFVVDKATGSE
jgi:16S rRNA (guanine(1405)-N(7))-methyltransferase